MKSTHVIISICETRRCVLDSASKKPAECTIEKTVNSQTGLQQSINVHICGECSSQLCGAMTILPMRNVCIHIYALAVRHTDC